MRKTWIVLAAFFLFPALVRAQDRAAWQIFGGYQYTYSDYGPIQDAATAMGNVYSLAVPADHTFTMTGGNFTIQKNIGKRWSGAMDIGVMRGTKMVDLSQIFQLLGYISSSGTQNATFNPSFYTLTFGPQYDVWNYRRVHVFVRGMGGASRSVLSMDDTTRKALNFLAPKFKTTTTDPAVMAGAGVEAVVYRHIFVRASGDYIHPFSSGTQNYFRISAGVGIERVGRLF
jgi:hypothetical protein